MVAYLESAEYAAYGIPDATDAQVAAATRVFNTFIGRPEGLLWSPDANGTPCWMTCLTPTMTYTGPAIGPGYAVVVTMPFGTFGYQNIGDVVILDRASNTLCEACVITAASGSAITLASVQFNHPAPSMDFGLTLLEEISGRVRLSRSPVANIFCGFGRYSYSREMRQISSGFGDFEALLVTNYGQNGVSGWNQLDMTQWDINDSTGAIRMPHYGHEKVRLRYVAGWSQANLPDIAKQCVANIVRNVLDADIPTNVKMIKAGDATIENFNSSLIDADTKAMAQSFRIMRI